MTVIGTILGALLMASTNMSIADRPKPVFVPAKVEFAKPKPRNKGKVPRVLKLSGTIKEVRDETNRRHLWIVVTFPDGSWWPQGFAVLDPKDATKWSCWVSLGSKRKKEDGRYLVQAVMADPVAAAAMQAFVTKHLASSKTGMKYPSGHLQTVKEVELQRSVAFKSGSRRADPARGCRR